MELGVTGTDIEADKILCFTCFITDNHWNIKSELYKYKIQEERYDYGLIFIGKCIL